MTLHSAPGRRSRQPHRHHRSAGPVLDPNRRCLAARSRRPARPKAGARWEQRSDPHRGNRYHVCDRLEGPLSHRRTGLHIFRSRYRPDHHHPRLPHRQARPDGLTEKFQIFLASFYTPALCLAYLEIGVSETGSLETLSSSEESATNRSRRRRWNAASKRRDRWFESSSLQRRVRCELAPADRGSGGNRYSRQPRVCRQVGAIGRSDRRRSPRRIRVSA